MGMSRQMNLSLYRTEFHERNLSDNDILHYWIFQTRTSAAVHCLDMHDIHLVSRCMLHSVGDEVAIYDPRPNGELCMSTGSVQAKNPSDFLTTEVTFLL
jgi:hypothetical protein